jgi:8-oxo-dGTP pyrophosphatase MutT (NUDIX family)/transcriptional regulator with XRE-family HTH domain
MTVHAPGADGAVHSFPVSVKGVAVQDGKVLLLENERAEWELPGGKLELGEDPAECVAREISEESGWKVVTGPLLDCWQYHIQPGVDVLIVTYGCHVRSSHPPVVSSEHTRAGLFTAAQVPALTMPAGYKRSIAAWFARDGSHQLTELEAAMPGLCDRCGAPGTPSGRAASCPACRPTPAAPSGAVATAAWLAAEAAPGRGLGDVLLGYRRVNGLYQQDVADMLGYDRTYISMIESGRRKVTDRGTLAHIAATLAIPPHLLGITDPDNASYRAMLEFGAAVIRLADRARASGRPADAFSELWPLITRLEARVTAGHADLDVMRLLARARVSFGVALGHLLPEERMATAAAWTGRALRIAWDLGDRDLLAEVLRMHGNELRKAGRGAAAVIRLRQSLELETSPARTGSGLVLLARAAASTRQAGLFDAATTECGRLLPAGTEVLFNAFTVREVRLRGLLATGRAAEAAALAATAAGDEPPSPQWRVIERITTAAVLAAAGDEPAAARVLATAAGQAEALRLPHQVQRIIRITAQPGGLPGGDSLHAQATAALSRLNRQLSEATPG